MLKTGRDRAEKEEGEKRSVDPFVSSSTVGALTASVLRSVAPLKPGLFSLSHTPHQDHHGAHDSIYFCLALDAFIF